jgi:hypothetical protein
MLNRVMLNRSTPRILTTTDNVNFEHVFSHESENSYKTRAALRSVTDGVMIIISNDRLLK